MGETPAGRTYLHIQLTLAISAAPVIIIFVVEMSINYPALDARTYKSVIYIAANIWFHLLYNATFFLNNALL